MTSTLLRDADPTADARIITSSDAADQMLRDILSTPRVSVVARRRRRLVLGAAVAGAIAAVVVAFPMLLAGGGLGGASAYAVERHSDGSFEVAIDFDQFHDPAALQASLDEQGIPAKVLSGPGTTLDITPDGKIKHPYSMPDCATYDRLPTQPSTRPDDPNQPVSFGTSRRFGDTSLRLHLDRLPAGATFVIAIMQSHGHVVALSGDVAVGAPPTCLP